MTPGQRLTAARAARGLSIREVARRFGVHRAVVKRWERDESPPRASDMPMVRSVYGIDLEREEVDFGAAD